MFQVYGIPNCDTVKKARTYLEEHQLEYEFVNFKKSPPTMDQISKWRKSFGDWPVNKKGPTYRKIKADFEQGPASEKMNLLMENSSAIKRPILTRNGKDFVFGFDEELYSKLNEVVP